MIIHTITTAYMGSHSYLLIEDGHAIIIDVGDADAVIETVREAKAEVDFCVVTHEHCDHILGCTTIRNEFDCKVYASEKCNENMKSSRRNFSQYYNAFIGIQTKLETDQKKEIEPFTEHADIVFSQELTLEWHGHSVCMHETPGHSQGSICILLDDRILFSGDTLLRDVATGVGFVGSSREQLLTDTLPWLQRLPKNMTVYPGHGESFCLGERMNRPIA